MGNAGLYKTPDRIAKAIQPALPLFRQNDLQLSASTVQLSAATNSIYPTSRVFGTVKDLNSVDIKAAIIGKEAVTNLKNSHPKSSDFSNDDAFAQRGGQVISLSSSNIIPAPEIYYSEVSDPEPYPQSSNDQQSIGYDSADPEPQAQYGDSITLLDSSDPEPSVPSYTSDLQRYAGLSDIVIADSANPDLSAGSYPSDFADPEPFASSVSGVTQQSKYYPRQGKYQQLEDPSLLSDSADPEPSAPVVPYGVPFDSADPEPSAYSGAQNGFISGNTYSDVADPEPPSYYGFYDSADPEPTASAVPFDSADHDPSAYSGAQNGYISGSTYSDVADPEPPSYYGFYDSSDPEPATFYNSNNQGLTTYDDAVADPEPSSS